MLVRMALIPILLRLGGHRIWAQPAWLAKLLPTSMSPTEHPSLVKDTTMEGITVTIAGPLTDTEEAVREALGDAGSADPTVALVLPCNVVLEQTPDGTRVTAADPRQLMTSPAMTGLAEDAAERLRNALSTVHEEHEHR